MGYVFKQVALNNLVLSKNQQIPTWTQALTSVETASSALAGSDAFKGNRANAAKQYLGDIYPEINNLLSFALESLNAIIQLYNDEYFNGVDKSTSTVIVENELLDLNDQLKSVPEYLSALEKEFYAHTKDIDPVRYSGRLYDVNYSCTFYPETYLQNYLKKLLALKDQVGDIENRYSTSELTELRDYISDARTFLHNQLNMKDIGKYDPSLILQDPAYNNVVNSYNKLYDKWEQSSEQLNRAAQTENELVDTLYKEYEERQKEAAKAKFVAQIICITVGVAATVMTGGAAGPVVAVTTGAITGAISSGVESYFDQRIGTPACAGTVDMAKVGWDAFKGGATGAVTSAVSFGMTRVTGGLTKNLSGAGKVAVKTLMGGAKKVATNASGRALNTLLETGDISKSLSAGLDGEQMLKDGVSGMTSALITDRTTAYIDKALPLKSCDGVVERLFKNGVHGGVPDLLSGIGSRFSGEIVSSGSFTNALDKAFDGQEMLIDTASGASSEMTQGQVQRKKVDDVLKSEEEIQKLQEIVDEESKAANDKYKVDALEKLEKKGVTGAQKTPNGCPSFSESNAIYTSEDGKPVTVSIDLAYTGSDKPNQVRDRNQDNFTAYDAFVKQGLLDPKTSHCDPNTGVITAPDPVTGEPKKYTVHHLNDYDVKTGKGTVELVDPYKHKVGHSGGRAQVNSAYENHGLKEKKETYDYYHDAPEGGESIKDNLKRRVSESHGIVKQLKTNTKPSQAPSEHRVESVISRFERHPGSFQTNQ